MKVIKHLYLLLMIKDIFLMMEYILQHMVIKIYLNKIKQKFLNMTNIKFEIYPYTPV